MKISTHPLITALSTEYALAIKAVREEKEYQIKALYEEFSWKYEYLKWMIEDRAKCSADRMDNSSAAQADRNSCRATNNYE